MTEQQTILPEIEVFRTDQFYILLNNLSSLWCNRKTGEYQVKPGWELANSGDPECLGMCYGLVGQVDLLSDTHLLLVREVARVGELQGRGTIYKIRSVSLLQLRGHEVATSELKLKQCHKHSNSHVGNAVADNMQRLGLSKTWGTLKSAGSTIKNTTQQAASLATMQVKGGNQIKDKEKYERRLVEELHRVFTDTDSFYFCMDRDGRPADLTNTLQRHCELTLATPSWRNADKRYFWNKHMLKEILLLNDPLAEGWVLPVVQGFMQIEQCHVEVGFDLDKDTVLPKYEVFTLSLLSRRSRYRAGTRYKRRGLDDTDHCAICVFTLSLLSRRSRYRAGTRYKRRGLDDTGHCANYVETEQIIAHRHHQVALTLVRASVPVYWSQPGYKYRPPPRLDKDEAETSIAFERHFEEELSRYGPICVVNLVEQTGKERVIWDAFTNHIMQYNHQDITYVTFDFHEYCKGMRFENVSTLVSCLSDVIHEQGFTWKDKQGLICRQNGVFRVNCIDCLDRTNVVQTALAKAVLELQLTKLGLITPEGSLPHTLRVSFQLLWANNGDTISKQYAGTNALKGDYTRTGERKLSGMMKDGMNSANRYLRVHLCDSTRQAVVDIMQGRPPSPPDQLNTLADDTIDVLSNSSKYIPETSVILPEINLTLALYKVSRYYLSRFKDAYRQATIDVMLGNPLSEDMLMGGSDLEEDNQASVEHVKNLIEDCKKLLISDSTLALGAWGLIDADPQTGDPSETEMDTILILTRDSYYVAEYDDQIDRVTKYHHVPLPDLNLIELGVVDLSFSVAQSTMQLFKSKNTRGHYCLRLNYSVSKNTRGHYCLRLNYSVAGQSGYCHTFRSTNLRFFNNVAVLIKTEEEMTESLRAVAETLAVGMEVAGLAPAPIKLCEKLQRKSTLQPSWTHHSDCLSVPTGSLPRNVSETQLNNIKSAGTKALSNMSQQLSKLNKLGIGRKHSENNQAAVASGIKQTEAKATFTLGVEQAKECTEDDDDDDDVVVGKADDKLGRQKSTEAFIPNVGIVMSNADIKPVEMTQHAPNITEESLKQIVHKDVNIKKYPLQHSVTDNNIDVSRISQKGEQGTPGIVVEKEKIKMEPPKDLPLENKDQQRLSTNEVLDKSRKLSHSSGEVDSNNDKRSDVDHLAVDGDRGSSQKELSLGISASQSENAIKSIRATATTVLTSPSTVLSPFSKLAKGVQNFGANLDPRKVVEKVGNKQTVTMDHIVSENVKLEERWKKSKCKSRLIAV
ncbi:phosphatidylinositide phosphatase SAC2 [Macrosteles quadrilineatus]|uniref:phosphatidylinositide phosphatase SAC2 n=1 Tax=Macrosteles quadrilineatus TaxID=74068 RepID=UPI0023E2970D|nr:phosphatidylinositide phosphatase SAC2 [Macrosteles quadrilineatus]